MKNIIHLTAWAVFSCFIPASAFAFEGRITATVSQGGQTAEILYTVGKDQLRIEKTDTNRPHARNIVHLQTGDLTLLFPHNRSFVRLKTPSENARPAAIEPANVPGMPPMPAMPQPPPGAAPHAGLPPTAMPQSGGMPSMPSMPMMPPMPEEPLELKPTGETTNRLGCACQKWELRHHGEVMEIWATDQLLPFQDYVRNQPPRFGPRTLEERWGALVRAKKLFPLLAVLRFDGGGERLRFEVRSIQPEKIEDKDGMLFQPPSDYHEIEPLPF